MKNKNNFPDVEVVSVKGIIDSLKIYFREVWCKEVQKVDMVSALELKNFTKEDLSNFALSFRDALYKALQFNFPKLIYSLFWSTFLLDSFSNEKKIFNRLEKIFWTTASDQDLEDYLIFFGINKENPSFEKKLNNFKEKRKRYLSKTRKKSIIPKVKSFDNDLFLQYFLANLDLSDQEIN